MNILPWILLAAAVAWFFASQRLNHRKRNQLVDYIIILLLSDVVRSAHQIDFQRWIKESSAANALALSLAAHRVIDNMAQRYATGDPADPSTSSVLGAHAMLWTVKREEARTA